MSIQQVKRNKRKVGEILLAQGYINQAQLDHALEQHATTGISLGTVLVKLGFIDEDTLNAVLGKQLELSYRKRIGDLLVEQGYITQQQLANGLAQQKTMAMPLGKCLVKLGYIEETKLLDVLAAQLDLQHINLENFKFNPGITRLISEEMARSYKTIPLYEIIGGEEDKDLVLEDTDKRKEEDEGLTGDEEGRQIIKIVNLIVSEAIRLGASDIHLEPQERNMRIRYRIDGELMEQNPIPARIMVQIVSRLKVLGGMDIAEKRKPLDGRAHIKYRGNEVDLRLSTFPTLLRSRGVVEKMVIRIIDPNQEVATIDKIGFSPSVFPSIARLIELPDGIILTTGPTGSGKSSTLYAFVQKLASPSVNVVTMEDPVEKNIPGITQGQINNLAGFTFAAGMRAILRQDPDVIMLGEMRDKETSEMAIQAALTGHLVISTLHTNDAAGAFTRLLDMGVEPFLVTSCVKGVLAQRLVRRICEKCRHQVEVPDVVLEGIGIRPGTPFFQGKGCQNCNNTGYRGRLALFELLIPDEHLHHMILERKSSEEIKLYAIRQLGMATLRRDGLEKALAGQTTIEQVVAVSQSEM